MMSQELTSSTRRNGSPYLVSMTTYLVSRIEEMESTVISAKLITLLGEPYYMPME